MGGVPFLTAVARGLPVIAVRSNQTVLSVTAQALLGQDAVAHLMAQGRYYEVHNYDEAVGLLQRLKLGLHAPNPRGVARV
jgi:hypothetical protein